MKKGAGKYKYPVLLIIICASFAIPFLIRSSINNFSYPISGGTLDLAAGARNLSTLNSIRLAGNWRYKLIMKDMPLAKNADAVMADLHNYNAKQYESLLVVKSAQQAEARKKALANLQADEDPGRFDASWELIDIPSYRYFTASANPDDHFWLRMRILLPRNVRDPLFLYYRSMQVPDMLFVNGQELITPGYARIENTPVPAGETGRFAFSLKYPLPAPATGEVIIAVRIAARSFAPVDFMIDPLLVTARYNENLFILDSLYLAILTGVIFIMMIYYFLLWFEDRDKKANLYFFLYCIVFFCKVFTSLLYVSNIFPAQEEWLFEINAKFIFWNYSLGWILYTAFFFSLFEEDFNGSVLLVFQILGAFFSVAFLISQYQIYNHFKLLCQLITLAIFIWLFVTMLIAWKKKREGANILLPGMVIYFISIIADMLSDQGILNMPHLHEWGFVLFLFFYAQFQFRHFTQAYVKAQYLAVSLDREIEKQTYFLRKQKQELEQVNFILNTQKKKLEETNIRQQETDHFKTLFFHNISHEFRTPLTLILSPLEAALAGAFGAISGELKEQLQVVEKYARHLLHLINQILDLAKVEAGKETLERTRVDIAVLFRYAAAAFCSLAERAGLQYEILSNAEHFITFVDKEKIEKVLHNLLSNAFKFTANGGRITAQLTVMEGTRHVIRIAVSDSGIGIPAAELPHIFERFRQVDNSLRRKYEGTGIGLSIVKEYVELHGGTVEVNSQPGRGSEFVVHIEIDPEAFTHLAHKDAVSSLSLALPVPDIDTLTPAMPGQAAMHAGKAAILLVEDNKDMCLYLHKILVSKYRVYTAANGRKALDLLAADIRPDLILCDVMMEEMDGFTFYQYISGHPVWNNIPLVFLTARAEIEEKLSALALGAIDYLYKPFSIRELQLKIDSILKYQKLKQILYEKDKYATIGMLVGGIMHEILNPLGGIHAPLENLQRKLARLDLPDNPKFNQYFEQVFTSLQRIEKLVKSSRILFYRSEMETESIDFSKLIASIRDIFRNKIKNRIQITAAIDESIKLYTSYDALTHILINLISNAIDAIAHAGEIRIKVLLIDKVPALVVGDNGSGITRENLAHIFDPFFTGKEAGKGTGMGLYFVKTLVVKLGWTIEVFSEPGKGTEFILHCGSR